MRSSQQDPQDPTTTTVARSSRGKERSSWTSVGRSVLVRVVIGVVLTFSGLDGQLLDQPVEPASPSACVVERSFDAHGVERQRLEVCRSDA